MREPVAGLTALKVLAYTSVLALGTALAADPPQVPPADTARATLVATETAYIDELLDMSQLDLAKQHLTLLRDVAPRERQLLRYFTGRLALIQRDWETAATALRGLSGDFSDAQWSHILRGNYQANYELGDLDAAAYQLKLLGKTDWPAGRGAATPADAYIDGRPEWVPQAFLQLGRAYLQQAYADNETVNVQAREQGRWLLGVYRQVLPGDEQPGWIELEEASILHTRLLHSITELSNADTANDVPPPLRPLALRVRGFYRLVMMRYPDSQAGKVAQERIVLLDQLMREEADPNGPATQLPSEAAEAVEAQDTP